ncbi:glycerate kinase-like isoform X2 [Antedon mediterranea]
MSKSLTYDAEQIFEVSVNSVLPHQMVKRSLLVDGNRLVVDGCSYSINHNVHMVGFGKAVIGMAAAVEEILEEHLVQGVVSVPFGIQESFRASGRSDLLLKLESKVKVVEGAADNLPDEPAMNAAKEIASVAENVGEDDILIVLISGGGSALLPLPVDPVTLNDKLQATKILARSGATIQELNTVRKKLSKLKGGGLARLAKPAKVISFILSDIINDQLDMIASGPTVADASNTNDALAIISKFGEETSMPSSVMDTLKEAATKHQTNRIETNFSHVQNVIVGSNKIALQRGCEKAQELGYYPLIMSSGIHGEAKDLADAYCNLSMLIGLLMQYRKSVLSYKGIELKLLDSINILSKFGVSKSFGGHLLEYIPSADKPLCLLVGGEPTVTLKGNGKGGRNQELALAAAVHWQTKSVEDLACSNTLTAGDRVKTGCQMVLLSAGTDGQDGPTDAAGAIAYPSLCNEARNLHPQEFLDNNDSYSFYSTFNDGMYLIKTGLTGTNVMDIHIMLFSPNTSQ